MKEYQKYLSKRTIKRFCSIPLKLITNFIQYLSWGKKQNTNIIPFQTWTKEQTLRLLTFCFGMLQQVSLSEKCMYCQISPGRALYQER